MVAHLERWLVIYLEVYLASMIDNCLALSLDYQMVGRKVLLMVDYQVGM